MSQTIEELRSRNAGTLTVVELLRLASERVDTVQREGMHYDTAGIGGPNMAIKQAQRDREFSIAKTHIEEAGMRVTRGIAMSHDVFGPVDLEDPGAVKRAKRAKE